MRKVNWKYYRKYDLYTAMIGFVQVCCTPPLVCTKRGNMRRGYIGGAGTPDSCNWKSGPTRRSLEKAQEDAIRIAKELLEEYHTTVVTTMKSLGMDIE